MDPEQTQHVWVCRKRYRAHLTAWVGCLSVDDTLKPDHARQGCGFYELNDVENGVSNGDASG